MTDNNKYAWRHSCGRLNDGKFVPGSTSYCFGCGSKAPTMSQVLDVYVIMPIDNSKEDSTWVDVTSVPNTESLYEVFVPGNDEVILCQRAGDGTWRTVMVVVYDDADRIGIQSLPGRIEKAKEIRDFLNA